MDKDNENLLAEIEKHSMTMKPKTKMCNWVGIAFLLILVAFIIIATIISVVFPAIGASPYFMHIFDFIMFVTIVGSLISQLVFEVMQRRYKGGKKWLKPTRI